MYRFDGVDDYNAYTRPSTITVTANVTIALFVREVAGGGALKGFLSVETDSTHVIATAYFDGTRNGFLVHRDNGTFQTSSKPSSSVTITNLNHLVIQCDSAGTRPSLFINGTQNDANDGAALSPWITDGIHVGRGVNSSLYANCDIAELGMWDVTLTAAEITALSNGYSPLFIRPDNLQFYAPLVRDANDKLGMVATLTSAPAIVSHPRMIYPGARPYVPFVAAAAGDTLFAQALM